MLRLSNSGRVLSAVSLTRLCAVIVKDLPALCSDPPTGCMLSDNLVRLSAVSQLTEHDVRYVRVFLEEYSVRVLSDQIYGDQSQIILVLPFTIHYQAPVCT